MAELAPCPDPTCVLTRTHHHLEEVGHATYCDGKADLYDRPSTCCQLGPLYAPRTYRPKPSVASYVESVSITDDGIEVTYHDNDPTFPAPPTMREVIDAVHAAKRALGYNRLPQRIELTQDEFDALVDMVKASFPLLPNTNPAYLQPKIGGIDLVVREQPFNPNFPQADVLRAQLRAQNHA